MKIIVIYLAVFLSFQSLFSQERDAGMLLWYTFNADTYDYSGNEFDGVSNTNAYTFDRFGNQNAALFFDGINDYVALPNDARLKPQLPVSMMFWVKFDNLAPQYTTIFTNDFSTSAHSGVWTNLSTDGRMTVSYGDNTGFYSANRRTKIGTSYLQTGRWYHIAVLVYGPNEMEIFINCKNDGGTYSGTGGSLVYGNYFSGSVGRKDANAGDNTYYFRGILDEFKYYSRPVTENEILTDCKDSQTQIIELPSNKLIIYPNPTNEILTISVSEKYDKIEIQSIEGKLIFKADFSEKVNVSELPKGIYILRVTSSKTGTFETTKFVKR